MAKNEELAAQFDALAQCYVSAANTKIAPMLKKVAEDLRKGKPRVTVLRDARKVKDEVPGTTISTFVDQALAHWGQAA